MTWGGVGREVPLLGHAMGADSVDVSWYVTRTPGHDGATIAEDVAGDVGRHVRGGHRAARRLAEDPRRAGVTPGDLFDDQREGHRIELATVEAPRQQESEEPRVMQCVNQGLGDPALTVDLIGRGGHAGPQLPGSV